MRGESHPSAKLTWEQVDEIRSVYAGKQVSMRDLGKKYAVAITTIRYIIYEYTWKLDSDLRHKQVTI